jgi:hypothetical protein
VEAVDRRETVAVVKGRLLDEAGRGVPSGTVYFISGPVALPDIAQLTGADGEFVLSVPVDGRYRIGARAPGRIPAETDVDVSSTEVRFELTLKAEGRAG